MRAGMSYFHETIWKGVPKFLRRVDTALKNIGIDERVPYNAPLIQFSSWMGGDRDGKILLHGQICSGNSLVIELKKKRGKTIRVSS
jgi:phosphoenolpyruvate carboxylase